MTATVVGVNHVGRAYAAAALFLALLAASPGAAQPSPMVSSKMDQWADPYLQSLDGGALVPVTPQPNLCAAQATLDALEKDAAIWRFDFAHLKTLVRDYVAYSALLATSQDDLQAARDAEATAGADLVEAKSKEAQEAAREAVKTAQAQRKAAQSQIDWVQAKVDFLSTAIQNVIPAVRAAAKAFRQAQAAMNAAACPVPAPREAPAPPPPQKEPRAGAGSQSSVVGPTVEDQSVMVDHTAPAPAKARPNPAGDASPDPAEPSPR